MERIFIENQYTAHQHDPHGVMFALPGSELRPSKLKQFTNRMTLSFAELLIAYGKKLQDRYRQPMYPSA
jgi:hypothetical protein